MANRRRGWMTNSKKEWLKKKRVSLKGETQTLDFGEL